MSSFPRGGAVTPPTPDNVSSNKSEAPSDFLFGNTDKSTLPKHKKRSRDVVERYNRVEKHFGGGNVTHFDDKKPPTIVSLSFSHLTPGYKLLGYVKQHVSDDLTLVSLQNHLTGYVLRKSGSPPLPSTLPLHTYLPFSLVSIDKTTKRLQLSPSTDLINRGLHRTNLTPGLQISGTVLSSEDHGYVISSKINGTTAFLPTKFTTQKIELGGSYMFIIKHYNHTSGQITLSSPPSSNPLTPIPQLTSPSASPHTLKSILPGMKVKFQITSLSRNGILVTFMNLHGAVHEDDIDGDFRSIFKGKKGVEFEGVVSAVDGRGGTVRVSYLRNLVEGLKINLPKQGKVIEGMKVVRVSKRIGAVLEKEGKEYRAFVHEGDTKFKGGEVVERFRVTGFWEYGNMIKGSCRKEIIEARILNNGDVEVGMKITGTIVKGVEGGRVVEIGNGVKALLRDEQCYDSVRGDVGKDFDVGKKVLMRVLRVKGDKIYVTCKKSLVGLKNLFKDVKDPISEEKTVGYVSNITEKGITVRFFGECYGICSSVRLKAELGVEDLEESYKIGGVVRCRVLGVKKGKMFNLSLDMRKKEGEDEFEEEYQVEVGEVLENVKIIGRNEDGYEILYKGIEMRLPYDQVSDSGDSNTSLKNNSTVKKAMILSKDRKYPHTPILTSRPGVTAAYNTPSRLAELKLSDTVVGWVCNKTSAGSFVRFCNYITGICPTIKGGGEFEVGQTVTVKITSLDVTDAKKPKILLTPVKDTKKGKVIKLKKGVEVGRVEVLDIKKERVNVKLLDGRSGANRLRIHYSNYLRLGEQPAAAAQKKKKKKADDEDDEIGPNHVFFGLKVGSIIEDVRVLKVDEVEGVTYVDLGNKEAESDPSEQSKLLTGVIESIVPSRGMFVCLSPGVKGFLSGLEIDEDVSVLNDLQKHFQVGEMIKVRVVLMEENKINLTTFKKNDKNRKLTVGGTVNVRVNRNLKEYDAPSLMVEIRDGKVGRIGLEELNDEEDWTNMPLAKGYKNGLFLKSIVLSLEPSIKLSLRSDPTEDAPVKKGDILKGYVKSTTKKGCYIKLRSGLEARCLLKDLSDVFIADPVESFKAGRLVKCVVLKREKDRIDVSLRESLMNGEVLSFDDITLGDKLPGEVVRVESYGVFIKILSSDVTGLCHVSELSDEFVEDIATLYDLGDVVLCKVLGVGKEGEKGKVSLGLKKSYFDDDMEEEDSSDDDEEGSSEEEEGSSDEEEDDEEGVKPMDMDDSEDEDYVKNLVEKMEAEESDEEDEEADSDEDEEDSDEDDSDSDSDSDLDKPVGFDFNNDDDEDSDSGSDSDDDEPKQKKKKKLKLSDVDARELALASGDADSNPESPSDFERLLLASPNDSTVWIKYMAYHLGLNNPDDARKVGLKAIKRIPGTEEEEKLNVFMAMVSLEVNFGDSESIKRAIAEAAKSSDVEKVALRAGEVLTNFGLGKTDKKEKQASLDLADNHFKTYLKKLKQSVGFWLGYMKHLLKTGRGADASDLLKRSLKSLPKHEHTTISVKFASLEFEEGSVERGRTIFETILSTYKKKLDIWFVYADREVKSGNVEEARGIFKRLAEEGGRGDKQMKSVFKKWYQFEEGLGGGGEGAEKVKRLAREYVENNM
ncbi:hypothetical protein TrVE_jg1364 [Triparma verrucosa]|uniref:S1 motif domain-containing protein n=1 Tax=Triparma verrucosa TaxID=1606542 RepID=A0A9W7DN90_9STRA|nr:hypothetical protein TrVE_jg1364 [Triparma verrucosa]